MSKQTRLPLDNRDVSRFFNNSVYNRSIKLWVNNTCFTCSRLILAQHSNIFEQHLRDSPPSVLLEDFHNVEGAENAIQDALILLYGGAVNISMSNIQMLSRFAVIYNIKELLKVCMDWIKRNLCVENVMMFFKALQTNARDGSVEVPEIIRKFMEERTGQIVDHLLSSSDNIDDEFLLAMLELPSSSVLVQRCLKSGILPDPIVELIFKHSNTINVNFLLHDDKRTYVRLITILKSKARSYKDMEKIIDIQQKCISKMCHPYGSFESIAMTNLTPAPSLATMAPPPPVTHPKPKISNTYQRSAPRTREEYHPKSLEMSRHQAPQTDDAEYLMPEELIHRQGNKMMHDYNSSHQTNYNQEERYQDERQHRHQRDEMNNSLESSQDTLAPPPNMMGYNDRNRVETVEPEKSFTSQRNQDRMPASVVAQLKHNLEKNFVAKYPEQSLKQHPQFRSKYNDNKDDYISDVDTHIENNKSAFTAPINSGMKSLSLSRDKRQASDDSQHKTNYAQVYMKKSQLHAAEDNRLVDQMNSIVREQTQNVMDQQNEMMLALNKLAEQQAIIEHTYDNMSIASGRVGSNRVDMPNRSAPLNSAPQPYADSRPRLRTNSGQKRSAMIAAESVTDFEDDLAPTRISGSRNTSTNSSLRAPIHIPTTFATHGSARASTRSSKPPTPPSNPPPGSTSFFVSGAPEAKPTPVTRPPPTLYVPPPPAEQPFEDNQSGQINLESISAIDSGPGFAQEMPLDCLPDHDRMTSPPLRSMRSPPSIQTTGSSRPMSPSVEDRGRSRAPLWASQQPTIDNNKLIIPDLRAPPLQTSMTQDEILQQSAIMLNKRSRSKSKERAKSKERKSVRKKKGQNVEKMKNISVPMSFLDKDVKTLPHPTKDRPKSAKKHPPSRAKQDNKSDSKPRPRQAYHIKHIPSNIPGNNTSTV